MKINSEDFRVRPGEKVKLGKWPTILKPFCKSKKRYQKLLGEHVEELNSRQKSIFLALNMLKKHERLKIQEKYWRLIPSLGRQRGSEPARFFPA